MGAKGVELPFSYERTRAATPADVYVKVPDQKKKKKAPQRHPATDAAKAASRSRTLRSKQMPTEPSEQGAGRGGRRARVAAGALGGFL